MKYIFLCFVGYIFFFSLLVFHVLGLLIFFLGIFFKCVCHVFQL